MMRANTLLKSALFAAGLSISSVSFAQADTAQVAQETTSETADSTDDIIVQGEIEETRRAYARNFLKTVGIGWGNRQTARWVDEICPQLSGGNELMASYIVGRILSIAEYTGAPVAEEGCSTNLNIIFVEDGATFVEDMRRKSWRIFGEVPRRKRDFVFASDAPVRWWYATEVMGKNGKPLVPTQPMGMTAECGKGEACSGGAFQLPTGPDTAFNQDFGNSRISTTTQRQIRAATVVIEASQVKGIPMSSLADYIALVSLSELWPDEDQRLDKTILSLFDEPKETVETFPRLSFTDEAFLCALYRMPLNRTGRRQKGRITHLLTFTETACDNEYGD